MNKFIAFSCSLLISLSSIATESKRPSWSQGLPERKNQPTPPPQIEKPITKPSTNHALFRKQLENLSQQNQTLNDSTNHSESFTEIPLLPQQKKLTSADKNHTDFSPITVIQSTRQNKQIPEHYPWEITRLTPVVVPRYWLSKYPTVMLDISINPNGQVNEISVNELNPMPDSLKTRIERSIKRWHFTAPKDYGITENIVRPFEIQLQAGSS